MTVPLRVKGFTARAGLLAVFLCAAWGRAPAGLNIDIAVLDPGNQPIAGALVQLTAGNAIVAQAVTDAKGHVKFADLKAGYYQIAAGKQGFIAVQKRDIDLVEEVATAIELTLTPARARKESIEVKETVTPVEAGASTPERLQTSDVRELPGRPATVADALPLTPGVVREPGGGIRISAAAEHRSSLIVNSADVTDPATGQFGLTVPIDSVDVVNVFQTPYLAEYGRFTAGLVSVETRRGGDKWKWELNDPFPEFRIRSYHLRGLKDATPRLNFEGPLIPAKLFISEGFEYEIRKTAVYTLPFPRNQKLEEGINSFSQLDWVVSDKQLATATLHVAPQRLGFVNINFFNPQPTAPDASTHNYTGTLAHRLTLGGGLLESIFSATRFDAAVWPRGSADLTFTPAGNFGNYFSQQTHAATRISGAVTYSFAPVKAAGTHHLKAGTYFAASTDEGQLHDRPIDIVDMSNRLLERIAYSPGAPYKLSDFEYAFFAQDHWLVSPRLALDLGVRSESQQVSEAFRLAPRVGIAWSPFADKGTLIHAGFGWFYDRVPLNVYSFQNYPDQIITTYDGNGQVLSGPDLFANTLGRALRQFGLVFGEPADGNFSPRSSTWSIQLEQPITPVLKLRLGYLQNDADSLVLLFPVPPDPTSHIGAHLLSGAGEARYRQFEATARVRLNEGRQLFFSYVRSSGRGDLNDFGNYLGSFPQPIVRPNQFGNLAADLPNRFLAWGLVQLPMKFRIAPVVEYRNGFPYFVTDAGQNYVGVPNQNRFPNFLSVDARVSKDIQVNPKYAVRLSVSSFNLTNHFNPEAVHPNIADPAYGLFFGHRGRRFTADFDVLF
jgi:Carboxypeptidase regulatory-like domain